MNCFISFLLGAILAVHLMSCAELSRIEREQLRQGLSRFEAAPAYLKNKPF